MNGKIIGFTLIELLVVLAIIALMTSIVTPNFFRQQDQAREVVLKQNLQETRNAIDKFYGDKNRYPDNLDELVTNQYLKKLPFDPETNRSDSWHLEPSPDGTNGVYDLHSTAQGKGLDGSLFSKW